MSSKLSLFLAKLKQRKTHRVAVVMLCLIVLILPSCATILSPPSVAPKAPPASGPSGEMTGFDKILGIAAFAAVGLLLFHKYFIKDSEKEPDFPKPDTSTSPGWIGESQIGRVTWDEWASVKSRCRPNEALSFLRCGPGDDGPKGVADAFGRVE